MKPGCGPGHSARLLVVLLLAFLAVSGCRSFQVRTDFDPQADFAAFSTWAWLEPAPPQEDANPFQDNTLLRKRVREAVTQELRFRGLREVPVEEASLLVTFHVTIQTKTTGYSSGSGYGYGPHYGRYHGYGAWGGYSSITTYDQGTLILDFVDRAQEQLVWRGWVNGAVPTVDSSRDRVGRAVREIIAKYPTAAPTRDGT